MKKILSFFLVAIMLFTMIVPVTFAENAGTYSIEFESDINANTIVAEAVYTPVGNETKAFVAILALYSEDNELLNFVTSESVNNTARVSIPNQENAYTARAFVWDSLTGLNHLTDTIYTAKSDFMEPTEFVDFIVDVETGREPVVLQLTDTQIQASTQMDAKCFDYVRETVEATKPDLILVTGDLLFGRDDTDGSILEAQIAVFESFKIPWAPVFGNHDNESPMGVDWQCEQFENAEYCLFKQRTLTGNGNYTVGIRQGGELKRVFFMMDSNGCTKASEESLANGHTKVTHGFGTDQILWFKDVATKINRVQPGMKYTFAFHIQPEIFRTALSQYGTVNADTVNNPINIDTHADKKATDFGYLGRDLKSSWDTNFSLYNSMKNLGCDSILVGHEHCNSASVVYDGVRFQYGQKSSVYDRANYMQNDGSILGGYSLSGAPIMGGTVMKMSETDGSYEDCYIYYCDTGIDDILNSLKTAVAGLQIGTDLTADSDVIYLKTTFEGENAFAVTRTVSGKVYFNVDKIKNNDTLTFRAYIPEDGNKFTFGGNGELYIRWKKTDTNGYIYMNSASETESLKLTLGEWKTYTIDISDYGDDTTEFSIVIPVGNTIYLNNIALSGGSTEEIVVPGMQIGDGLTLRSGTTVEAVSVDGVSAYKVAAEDTRGRIYVDLDRIANKDTFTFSALVPDGTPKQSDNGSGELLLRIKGVSSHSGYEYFSSESTVDSTKVPLGEWKTYTVDISSFGTSCTEFSITTPTYSTIYIKDVAVTGEEKEEVVSGLQIGTDLTVDSDMVIEKTTVGGESAFSVYRGTSGKVRFNVDDIANGNTLTFSAYVPTGTGAISSGTGGEVNIRWKKSDGTNGYYFFKSTSTDESMKVPFDQWKTYTIDISGYGADTSEFSFVIAVGSTVYLKDITIE